MNLLLLTPEELIRDSEYSVRDRQRVDHILNILKKREGESVRAGILNESLGSFRITAVREREIKGSYRRILFATPRAPKLVLFSALQRPPTVEKILQLAGTWGISEIGFFNSELSRKEYLTSPVWRAENLSTELRLGMEQGRNVFEPRMRLFFSRPQDGKKPVLTDDWKAELSSFPGKLFYLDRKGESLASLTEFENENTTRAFLLGPEPGWSRKEKEGFRKVGALPIRLSRSVLRSEQALAFLLSQQEEILERKGIRK
ncbi:RsmE family RNA methyltransferase [Leptospira fletcheri]|uniref:Ribosomal RNA small subunit methyltransferase E n=1 Tax=Leptospira fletcheri TaxID=2484981 RepID=A0A4R9GJP4_9LEPT|nr:RsmE family RNA methyltransferase [Leptospira fletcheri]TGK13900.1 RsmE family RNA methyltransferase [Leptospira fletcheri]